MANQEKVWQLLDQVRQCPGSVYVFHKYLVAHDYRSPWRPRASILSIPRPGSCLLYHLGVRAGATEVEIRETVEMATHTRGGSVPAVAIRILPEVLEEKGLHAGPKWIKKQEPRKLRRYRAGFSNNSSLRHNT